MARRRRPSEEPNRSSGGNVLGFSTGTLIAAVIAAIVGAAFGIILSTSSANTDNVVSREAIDRSVPDAEFCIEYGASAVVADLRVFLTFNPFSVYVTQPAMQPGCVVRKSNWTILQQRDVISSDQARECKNRLNTFGFTGALESSPQVDCVYQNNSAGNLFARNRDGFTPSPNGDDF